MTKPMIRQLAFVLILTVLMPVGPPAAPAETPEANEPVDLKIYLPRESTVEGEAVRLDDVAMISGTDRQLTARARQTQLCRAPYPGESFTISRQNVLARLAGSGISRRRVTLVGADEFVVRRDTRTLSEGDLIARAEAFLKIHHPDGSVGWTVARRPGKPANLPATAELKFHCRLTPGPPRGHAGVEVLITDARGRRKLHAATVLFKLQWRWQRVVATQIIQRGEAIAPTNAKVETVIVQHEPDGPWVSPFGRVARRTIQPGVQITDTLLVEQRPSVVVERNKIVRVKLQGPGWLITTLGKALQDGRVGELIRVQNIDSKKIIVARVDAMGDVIPLNAKPGSRR
jgi:flagella basal body P-ring formation protein FlgA